MRKRKKSGFHNTIGSLTVETETLPSTTATATTKPRIGTAVLEAGEAAVINPPSVVPKPVAITEAKINNYGGGGGGPEAPTQSTQVIPAKKTNYLLYSGIGAGLILAGLAVKKIFFSKNK